MVGLTNQEEVVQVVIVSVQLFQLLQVILTKLQSVVVVWEQFNQPAEIEELQEMFLHLTHAP